MIFSTDTVATCDPLTYEEKIEIVQKEFRATDFPRLRLVQNWYWDDRQQRLLIDLQRFAPLRPVDRPAVWKNMVIEQPLFFYRNRP